MKILNFGSLNIDYVYSVDHFVRAGETISSTRLEQFCGGKGLNQSVAFARAGAQVYHAGCIGAEGTMLVDMLRQSGVNTQLIQTIPAVSSGHAIIQVAPSGENCILLYGGANQEITETMIDDVLAHFTEGDLLILQNETNAIDSMVRKANQKGMIVALNPSPFNEKITGESDPQKILSVLLKRYPHMKIVLTLGSEGSIYADATQQVSHGIFKTKAVDTTAAGDTFTGYFFSSVMNGASPRDALAIASAASSITVSRKGAAPSIPTMQEVQNSGYIN